MVGRCPPAEAAQGGGESVGAGGLDRRGEPREEAVAGTEGERRGRPVDPQGRAPAPGLDRVEEDAGEGELIDGAQALRLDDVHRLSSVLVLGCALSRHGTRVEDKPTRRRARPVVTLSGRPVVTLSGRVRQGADRDRPSKRDVRRCR
ncbi:Uncharacterised protein [Mycobacteroides abscessus subsp. abscessus]|nr:Uncharacterised protein [Mycobacteroides abscessus subsp. abscessus]